MRTMTQREKEIFDDLMDLYEFEVYTNEQGKLQVNDLQGACLGDICDDIFDDEWEILERMETYHLDYIINGLENTFNISFDTFEEWVDLLEVQDLEEFGYDLAVLRLLTGKEQKVNKVLDI